MGVDRRPAVAVAMASSPSLLAAAPAGADGLIEDARAPAPPRPGDQVPGRWRGLAGLVGAPPSEPADRKFRRPLPPRLLPRLLPRLPQLGRCRTICSSSGPESGGEGENLPMGDVNAGAHGL
jgi:hypothetical protein